MNEKEARSVLGIGASDSIADARKAHRNLAKVFHPDRHSSGTPAELAQATEAMSRINQALDTLVELEAEGILGRRPDSSPTGASGYASAPRFRFPNINECFLCGSYPAAPMKFRGYAGAIFWWASRNFEGSFCRACAKRLFRESQARNLAGGWWGLVFFPAAFSFVANLVTWAKARRMPEPMFRDPDIAAPLDYPPDPGRPVLARPAVLIALAVVVTYFIVSGVNGGSSSRSIPSTSVPNPTISLPPTDWASVFPDATPINEYAPGSCWSSPNSANMIGPVPCSDVAAASYVVSYQVSSESDCPANTLGTVKDDFGNISCLASNR
jgi:hypothetical protein